MAWQKVNEYAQQHNINPQSVYKKIKRGTLLSKKEKGMWYVDELAGHQDVQQEQPQQVIQTAGTGRDLLYEDELKRKLELENALKAQKLKNLQQDTIIKKQKQMYTKQLYRQQYVEGVFEAFTESFANIKNLIIELKLKKEDNNRFKRVFSECLKKFEINLKKYLAQADKKELETNENNQK